jgi:hypothetical protein
MAGGTLLYVRKYFVCMRKCYLYAIIELCLCEVHMHVQFLNMYMQFCNVSKVYFCKAYESTDLRLPAPRRISRHQVRKSWSGRKSKKACAHHRGTGGISAQGIVTAVRSPATRPWYRQWSPDSHVTSRLFKMAERMLSVGITFSWHIEQTYWPFFPKNNQFFFFLFPLALIANLLSLEKGANINAARSLVN